MEWTTERRYRLYQDWTQEEIQHIKENMAQSPWHTHYHVEPKTGLLNDPNGFSYFDGKWILFYQNFPFGAAHGLKSWAQLESDDLIHFKETGIKVLPDTPLDSHGAYSGSAMQFGDNLFLFYTGNVRDENWIRHPYQIGALMDKEGKITKIDKILIDQPADSTDHFRDPQIFNFKGQYYAVVGGQDLEKKGFVRLYKAVNNDYTNWQAVGDLDFANDRTAYMMECPNLVFIEEQPVLLYCPQGLDKKVLDYDNIFPNMYKIGASFDPKNAKMVDVSQLQNMDYGFEAYATQAFNAPDGRALAVSWLGLPDVLTHLTVLTTKEPSLWSRNSLSKTTSSTSIQSLLLRTFVLLKKPSQTVPKPRTLTNLNSTWKLIARARLSYLLIKKVRDFQSTLTL